MRQGFPCLFFDVLFCGRVVRAFVVQLLVLRSVVKGDDHREHSHENVGRDYSHNGKVAEYRGYGKGHDALHREQF